MVIIVWELGRKKIAVNTGCSKGTYILSSVKTKEKYNFHWLTLYSGASCPNIENEARWIQGIKVELVLFHAALHFRKIRFTWPPCTSRRLRNLIANQWLRMNIIFQVDISHSAAYFMSRISATISVSYECCRPRTCSLGGIHFCQQNHGQRLILICLNFISHLFFLFLCNFIACVVRLIIII